MTDKRKTSYQDPPYRFDWLIDQLGGPTGLTNRMVALDLNPPPVATITKWRQRNRVPGGWAVALVEFALIAGVITSISELR
jgi:hypothetical protein